MRWTAVAACAACFAAGRVGTVDAEAGARYAEKDTVPVIASKIGPYFNPSETYPYYNLPFCKPETLEHQSHNLGEIFSGDRKVLTNIEVLFKVPFQFRRLCKRTLSVEDVKAFHDAIDADYYYEMSMDGFLLWGYVGGIQTPTTESFLGSEDSIKSLEELDLGAKKFLYAHQVFSIAYNGDRIIAVNVTSSAEHRVDISALEEVQVDFTYAVTWQETESTERVEKFHKAEFLPATFEIHWLSIINSFVLVLLLTVFLAIILMRVLRNDFRYMTPDEEVDYGEDEAGWKLIHGDVFRYPSQKMLFSAILGAGTHLLFMVVLLLLLAVSSIISPSRKGALSTVLVVLYALTAGTSGFVSTSMYRQLEGKDWVWCTVLTALLFPGPLFVVFCLLNTVAVFHGSSAALPFGTIVAMFCLYLLVTFPLTVVGAVIAKRRTTEPLQTPCRTNKVKRQIPPPPKFRSPWIQILIAGFLPFSSIYIELHFVFSSIWGHRVYTLFGILFLAFVLLLVVTCFITVALIYFQLAIEDYRWWWRSVVYGGATSLFVYAYSAFYYSQRSSMSGTLQTSFFFGQMLIISWAFFLILGTVGFFSSLLFVRTIYSYLKLD